MGNMGHEARVVRAKCGREAWQDMAGRMCAVVLQHKPVETRPLPHQAAHTMRKSETQQAE